MVGGKESAQSALAVTSHCHMVPLLDTGPAQSRVLWLLAYPAWELSLAQILYLLPRCHRLGFHCFASLIPCLYAQTLVGKE